MAEPQEASVNQVLFVSNEDLQVMGYWPPELKALFDSTADQELAERIRQERKEPKTQSVEQNADHDYIPF